MTWTDVDLEAGEMSIKKVAELLGDSEKMVTEVYSHILEEKENTEEKIEAAVAL